MAHAIRLVAKKQPLPDRVLARILKDLIKRGLIAQNRTPSPSQTELRNGKANPSAGG